MRDTINISQYTEWFSRAEYLKSVDLYAAFLMAYVGLVRFYKDEYEEYNDRKLVSKLSEELSPLFKNIASTKPIEDFLVHESLHYYSIQYSNWKQFMYDPSSFKSNLQFIRHIRNNLSHGEKDFEAKSSNFVQLAYNLLAEIYQKILSRQNK